MSETSLFHRSATSLIRSAPVGGIRPGPALVRPKAPRGAPPGAARRSHRHARPRARRDERSELPRGEAGEAHAIGRGSWNLSHTTEPTLGRRPAEHGIQEPRRAVRTPALARLWGGGATAAARPATPLSPGVQPRETSAPERENGRGPHSAPRSRRCSRRRDDG